MNILPKDRLVFGTTYAHLSNNMAPYRLSHIRRGLPLRITHEYNSLIVPSTTEKRLLPLQGNLLTSPCPKVGALRRNWVTLEKGMRMPVHSEKKGKKFVVVDDKGKQYGSHATKEAAVKQVTAVNIAEGDVAGVIP
jgi:hypothetical protein